MTIPGLWFDTLGTLYTLEDFVDSWTVCIVMCIGTLIRVIRRM
jgi:hypothetical protein